MPNESFDIITAKNVTRFCSNEIYRLLKHYGVFIFREYGTGKGLVEITELFPGRIIRARAPESYVYELEQSGLSIVKFDRFLIKREFSDIESLINITRSYSLIKNYSKADQQIVEELYKNRKKIIVHSDPFIIIATKQKEKL
jgi:SAM-dependent methyltransferase